MENSTENITEVLSNNNLIPLVSKNQSKKELKRQRKEEYWATKKQEAKQAKRQRNQSNVPTSTTATTTVPGVKDISAIQSLNKQQQKEGDNTNAVVVRKQFKKAQQLEEFRNKCDQNFTVIIDCAFEDLHRDKAFKSMCQQIMFCYGYNRTHNNPVHLYVSV
jgi:Trm5-related predicted tRNA methylase